MLGPLELQQIAAAVCDEWERRHPTAQVSGFIFDDRPGVAKVEGANDQVTGAAPTGDSKSDES